ncbi:hypothetical protein [Pseudomonas fluorescens]|uniref:Transmembrane protein n=1 Tax=Pseudomonas fluorescens TaxID=294 RepID=A0A5E6XYH6_PSEFL|nr:hypothetical protein [Pseudomonas fluorescens]VVN46303.1 hypothetical protein PS655_05856 [Pseudomonas fluorescens]
MEQDSRILSALKRFRYLILAVMVIASLVNAFARFTGGWSQFWTCVGAQAWFTQAVFAYLRGGWVAIGPGGLSRDANPIGRALLAAVALGLYLLMFSYEEQKPHSIYERRASDWTMPTREEMRRSAE